MNDEQRKKWLPIGILAGALFVWTVVLALGAYLQIGSSRPTRDASKSLAMLGFLWLFLAIWGLLLWFRARRNRR